MRLTFDYQYVENNEKKHWFMFSIATNPYKPHVVFQDGLTFFQKLQICLLNGSVLDVGLGKYKIGFLTREAQDHYLLLNPKVKAFDYWFMAQIDQAIYAEEDDEDDDYDSGWDEDDDEDFGYYDED